MIGTIETERLVLRDLSQEDANGIYQLVNSAGWLKNIGDRNVHTMKDAERYIQTWALDSYSKHGFGPYAVLSKSGKFIGICGLFQRDYLNIPDLGFAFIPEYLGKGYGFESSKAIMQHANSSGFEKLAGITSKENIASQNLLKKLGFTEMSNPKIEDGIYFEIELNQ